MLNNWYVKIWNFYCKDYARVISVPRIWLAESLFQAYDRLAVIVGVDGVKPQPQLSVWFFFMVIKNDLVQLEKHYKYKLNAAAQCSILNDSHMITGQQQESDFIYHVRRMRWERQDYTGKAPVLKICLIL